jgi:serine phosphatase RsbU (regulator of sigma subunit)
MSISGYIRKKAVLRKLMPGIRFKFSFFIGVFISVILAAATYINYVNQSSILRKSFNDETENSLNYINPIVNSMESIRSNFLLIEDLKIRVNQKSKDLKKYKTYSLRKKDSVSNTFISIGKKLGMKVRYDYYYKGYESYYSTYLSKKDITDLEKKTASRLKQPDGRDISGSEYAGIQSRANKVMVIQHRIDALQEKFEENNSKLTLLSSAAEEDIKSLKALKDENRKIEIRLASEKKRIAASEKIFRKILNRYYNFQLKRLEDTGIYNSNIRIITYDYDGEIKSDTGGYFRESLARFAPLFENEVFTKEKGEFFSAIDIFSTINSHEYDYVSDKKSYHVRYVPVYKNPATSEMLISIIKDLDSNSGRWMKFLKEDARISSEIAVITGKISSRLNELKDSKRVPGSDPEFNKLYLSYRKLLNERDAAFDKTAPYKDEMKQISGYYNSRIKEMSDNLSEEFKKISAIKEKKKNFPDDFSGDLESSQAAAEDLKDEIKKLKRDMDEAREDIWKSEKLSARNAMRYIRDAAIYEHVILKQKPDPSEFRNYLRSSQNRKIEAMRWDTLRRWIMSARSETGIPDYVDGLKNVRFAEDGVLAYSRSEAEEYMWIIDSTPIAGDLGILSASLEGGLAKSLLEQNISGFHGVFIDKTDGVTDISSNRNRMIIYSAITALIAIVLTYFLAGFMVKRIQNIIGSARLAGTGNLQVEFPEKGLDEIEDLGASLNVMMHGLREKEELKGEIAAAGEIQKILMPEKIPSNLEGYYSIGTFYRSMQGVGGDYYDFIQLDDESIFFCIADVSSHGVGPAIVMSMLRAHIHGILRRGVVELKELLLELNRQIFIETPPNIFVTIFTGIINRNSNDVQYCSAGHLRPVVYRYKKNDIEILEGGGLPVGMDDNDIFADTISVKSVVLKPGDLFFQYTDGVSEAMDESRNLFTEERMYQEIKNYSRKKPEIMISKIAEAVETFTGKTIINSAMSELNDDIAMIALKRLK